MQTASERAQARPSQTRTRQTGKTTGELTARTTVTIDGRRSNIGKKAVYYRRRYFGLETRLQPGRRRDLRHRRATRLELRPPSGQHPRQVNEPACRETVPTLRDLKVVVTGKIDLREGRVHHPGCRQRIVDAGGIFRTKFSSKVDLIVKVTLRDNKSQALNSVTARSSTRRASWTKTGFRLFFTGPQPDVARSSRPDLGGGLRAESAHGLAMIGRDLKTSKLILSAGTLRHLGTIEVRRELTTHLAYGRQPEQRSGRDTEPDRRRTRVASTRELAAERTT